MDISKKNQILLERVKSCVLGAGIWRQMLPDVVYEIKQAFPRYSWVGIYLIDGSQLVLETFLGKPTAHNRIDLDKGICGASATQKQTLLIKDVRKDDRYISCDIAVKSEIVVPLLKNGEVLGVLDIDSNFRDAFSDEERRILEQIASMIANASPNIQK